MFHVLDFKGRGRLLPPIPGTWQERADTNLMMINAPGIDTMNVFFERSMILSTITSLGCRGGWQRGAGWTSHTPGDWLYLHVKQEMGGKHFSHQYQFLMPRRLKRNYRYP